jgi:hypothetical protein
VVPANDLGPTPGGGQQTAFFQSLVPLDDTKVALVQQRIQQLARLGQQRGDATIVLSAENLLDAGDNHAGFARLFAGLDRDFDVSLVAYIRRQDEFLIAAWGQWYMKLPGTIEAWLDRVAGKLGDWEQALAPWSAALPEARVIVRVFDRSRLVGGDVVSDYQDAAGLAAGEFERPPAGPVNASLNEIATRVAMRNRHLIGGVHDNELTDLLRRLGGPAAVSAINTGLYPDPAARRELLKHYAASNERVRERYVPALPEGGLFPDTFDAPPAVGAEERVERELDLLWSVAFGLARELRLARGKNALWRLDDVGEVGLAPPED